MVAEERVFREALAHHQAGRLEEAEGAYRELLRREPGHADALHYLGLVVHRRGRVGEGVEWLRRAVAVRAGDAGCWNNLGNMLRELGRLEEAREAYEAALLHAPGHVNARYHLGVTQEDMGAYEEAVKSYRAVLEMEPDDVEAWHSLGTALQGAGQLEASEGAFREVLARVPGDASAWYNLGNVLKEGERFEAAVAAYREAVAVNPAYAEAYNNLGVVMLVLSDKDEAHRCFDKALEIDPTYARAWENLTHTRRFGAEDDALLETVAALSGDPRLPREDLESLNFALGKMCDDRGQYERAFAHYREANRLKALSCHFSRTEFRDYISQIIEAFPHGLFDRAEDSGHPSELPVFIIGMPRSGTTLVEQILASHPEVHGGDELEYVDQAATRLDAQSSRQNGFPKNIAELSKKTLCPVAHAYVSALQRLAPSATRVTDKGLKNYLYLGLIALLLPHARVIECRRDRRDVCLSNFFQNYTKGLHFSYRLSDLAFYCDEYERLWSHWREVVPLPVYVLQYEELVADFEPVVRELVEFCGLSWNESCLNFFSTKRRVKTASQCQVRRPIYSSSVQRWRNYVTHLGPIAALG